MGLLGDFDYMKKCIFKGGCYPALLSLLLGAFYWPLESFIHSYIFNTSNFSDALLSPGIHEAWMRILISMLFIFFGIYVGILLKNKDELIDSLALLAEALEQAGEAVLVTDEKGSIEYVNQAFTQATGYSLEEMVGKNPSALQSGRQDRSFYQDMWHSIQTTGRWKGRLWNKRKDGQLYPEELHIRMVRLGTDQHKHYVGVFSDISHQIEVENQLLHAQKMEAIGTLVSGIAHDFNNILSTITGNLFLMRDEVAGKVNALDSINRMEKASYRAAEMIQHLLTFARKDMIEFKVFSMNSMIDESLKLVKATLSSDITLYYDALCDECMTCGDSTQLEQVFLNLVNNARDALADRDNP